MLLIVLVACAPDKVTSKSDSEAPVEDSRADAGEGEGETEETEAPACPEGLTLHFTTTAAEGDRCTILDTADGEPILTRCVEDELHFTVPDYASSVARCTISGDQLTCAGENQGAHWSEEFSATGSFDADSLEGSWVYESAWSYDSGTRASCKVQGTVSGAR